MADEITKAVETVTAPLTKDLTNTPIDMTDVIIGGMAAGPIKALASKIPVVGQNKYAEAFAELGGALVVGSMTKRKGKTAQKAGNMAQVGLAFVGSQNMVAAVTETIQKHKGKKATANAEPVDIFSVGWSMQ